MDNSYIKNNLPLKPRKEHLENICTVDDGAMDEILHQYCTFKRTAVIVNEDNYTEAFGFAGKEMKSAYGAECRCSSCGDSFISGYISKSKNKDSAIVLIEGDDGVLYEGYATPDDDNAVAFFEGEFIVCPFCGETLMVKRLSEINEAGELYAIRTQEIVTVGKYAAVMTWEWRRMIFVEGLQGDAIVPISAVVIDEEGNLHCFYRFNGEWEEEPEIEYIDALQVLYNDDDSINDLKLGGVCDPCPPDLTGTTGEKTGLIEFLSERGNNVVVYLQTWQEYHQIENLMKSPFGKTLAYHINEIVDQNISYDYFPTGPVTGFDWINWDKNKPHQMLGITKAELAELKDHIWDLETYSLFYKFNTKFGIAPKQFAELLKTFKTAMLSRFERLLNKESEKLTLLKVFNYLKKQKCFNQHGLELYADYIEMIGTEDEELIFPKNLEAAHDRITEIYTCKKSNSKLSEFRNVKKRYAELEYGDGDLCVILPSSPNDLVEEGEKLRHCVGGYVNKHASGTSVIFFVRHYRRPERSYYTLNIEFGKKEPREIQLHGYGNERHGENKQYTHSIPKKVRDFVDKWEEDVLKPWYKEQMKKALKEEKKTA